MTGLVVYISLVLVIAMSVWWITDYLFNRD